jgi:membrane protease YdiL (CAAX protease family)
MFGRADQGTSIMIPDEPPYLRPRTSPEVLLILRVLRHPFTRLVAGTFLLFVTAIIATIVLAVCWFIFSGGPPSAKDTLFVSAVEFTQALGAVPVYILLVVLLERRRVGELAPRGALREFAIGAAIGCCVMSIVVGILLALGAYRIEKVNGPLDLLIPIAVGLGSGFFEDALCRGIWFRVTEEWLGSWIGLIFSSLVFGLLHVLNDNATLAGCLAISFEAGLLLAAAFMLTRRLWMAIGIHASWNFTQGGIFGAHVSGLDIPGLITIAPAGPNWLTGGAFGPEGSIVALIVGTAAGLGVLGLAIRRGHWVLAPWNRPAPAPVPNATITNDPSGAIPFALLYEPGQPTAAEDQAERAADRPAEDRPDVVDEP